MNSRSVSFAAAALLVATSIGAVVLRSPALADVSEGDRPVLVPIAPCRLADTRPAPNTVGPRAGAIGPGETLAIDTVGLNGNCDIPADALAVSLNVTALGASDVTFLTFWPEGDRPLAASLNPAPGQPPVPNAVTTSLGTDGAFRVYNDRGSVHAVIDVNGYFAHHDHDDRYDTSEEVDGKIAEATAGLPGSGSSYTKQQSDDRYYERALVDGAISDATDGLLTADNVYTKPESDSRYYEQSVADDRFYEGDNVIIVPADGTPVENGTALESTLTSIIDADADNPYVIRLGAGEFDVGTDGLTMSDHVSIDGAGRTATVISSGGLPETFRADSATVVLADDVTLTDLTIRNTGGTNTDAIGLLGRGAGFRVENVRLDIVANGSSGAAGFQGADLSGIFDFHGLLSGVSVSVVAGSEAPSRAGGFGLDSSSGDMTQLTIEDSEVQLDVAGTGIGDLQGSCCNSRLVVRDTIVTLTAGGTGAGSTTYDTSIYDGVHVDVSGGTTTNYGFRDAGSGFRPQIRNSSVIVRGSGAAAIAYNNGRPFVTNTTLDASSVGIDANTLSSLAGTATVENSVIDAPIALRSATNGGLQRFRIGGTLFNANTLLDVVNGDVDARCTDVHTDDHEPVAADCTGTGPPMIGDRTILVPGGGTDLSNGQALTAAIAMVNAASPSDGDEWVIRLESGTFFFFGTVELPDFTRIEGAGMDETLLTCSGCLLLSADAPTTIADLTVHSGTGLYAADFDDDVRLERVRISATGSSGRALRIDGGDAVIIDTTLHTPNTTSSVVDTLRTVVSSISLDGVTFDGPRGRWSHHGGDIEVRDSSLLALYVPSGTASIAMNNTTIDGQSSTAIPLFLGASATGDIDLDHVIIRTGELTAVRIGSGDVLRATSSTFVASPTSTSAVIGTSGTVELLHSTLSSHVGVTTETCFATVDLETEVFLADTCP